MPLLAADRAIADQALKPNIVGGMEHDYDCEFLSPNPHLSPDTFDHYKGPITQLSINDNWSNRTSEALKKTKPAEALYIALPVDHKQAERLLDHLGFDIFVGPKMGWPTGYLDLGEQKLCVKYVQSNDHLSAFKIHFPHATTPIAEKISVLNILSRHLELMQCPATSASHVSAELPIPTASIEKELKLKKWQKNFWGNKYSHPFYDPIVSIKLPPTATLHSVHLEFSPKATKDDELYYREELSSILAKMARP